MRAYIMYMMGDDDFCIKTSHLKKRTTKYESTFWENGRDYLYDHVDVILFIFRYLVFENF